MPETTTPARPINEVVEDLTSSLVSEVIGDSPDLAQIGQDADQISGKATIDTRIRHLNQALAHTKRLQDPYNPSEKGEGIMANLKLRRERGGLGLPQMGTEESGKIVQLERNRAELHKANPEVIGQRHMLDAFETNRANIDRAVQSDATTPVEVTTILKLIDKQPHISRKQQMQIEELNAFDSETEEARFNTTIANHEKKIGDYINGFEAQHTDIDLEAVRKEINDVMQQKDRHLAAGRSIIDAPRIDSELIKPKDLSAVQTAVLALNEMYGDDEYRTALQQQKERQNQRQKLANTELILGDRHTTVSTVQAEYNRWRYDLQTQMKDLGTYLDNNDDAPDYVGDVQAHARTASNIWLNDTERDQVAQDRDLEAEINRFGQSYAAVRDIRSEQKHERKTGERQENLSGQQREAEEIQVFLSDYTTEGLKKLEAEHENAKKDVAATQKSLKIQGKKLKDPKIKKKERMAIETTQTVLTGDLTQAYEAQRVANDKLVLVRQARENPVAIFNDPDMPANLREVYDDINNRLIDLLSVDVKILEALRDIPDLDTDHHAAMVKLVTAKKSLQTNEILKIKKAIKELLPVLSPTELRALTVREVDGLRTSEELKVVQRRLTPQKRFMLDIATKLVTAAPAPPSTTAA